MYGRLAEGECFVKNVDALLLAGMFSGITETHVLGNPCFFGAQIAISSNTKCVVLGSGTPKLDEEEEFCKVQ